MDQINTETLSLSHHKVDRGLVEQSHSFNDDLSTGTFNEILIDGVRIFFMDYAKRLILDEKKTIGETAFTLGYSEPHHFSAAFRRRFGYAPRELK